MNDVTTRAALLLGFLALMPLIALIAVRVGRTKGTKKTRAVSEGATDAAAQDWGNAPAVDNTPADPVEAIPLADWTTPGPENGPDADTVFGATYLPTRPPAKQRGRHRA